MKIKAVNNISKLEQVHKTRLEKYKKENIYFCPHCRCIMHNGNYGVQQEDDVKWFKCIHCKGNHFNQSTVLGKHTGKRYHIPNNISVTFIISKMIIDLDKEGLSINEIHGLTHFSKELIRKTLKQINLSTHTEELSFFMLTRLKIPIEYCESVDAIKLLSLSAKVKYICTAFEKGCKYDLIVTMFRISKRDVTRIINDYEQTLSDEDLLSIYKARQQCTYKLIKKNDMLHLSISVKQYPKQI